MWCNIDRFLVDEIFERTILDLELRKTTLDMRFVAPEQLSDHWATVSQVAKH
jgi:hypothetical protein